MKKKSHTIEAAFVYLLKFKTDISESTRRGYNDMLRKTKTYGFADTPLESLTPAILKEFIDKIRTNEDLGEGTIYTYYTKLESAINYYMHDHGLEARGKIKGVMKAPHIKRGAIRYKSEAYLDTQDVIKLLHADVPEDLLITRHLLIRQCYTGMAMVDLAKMRTVDGYVIKDQDEEWFRYERTKTGRACEVPVTEVLRKNLEQFMPMPFSDRQYNIKLAELGKHLGFSVRLSSHVGRHTFGVLMLEAGFSIESVSKMMGHSSISITQQAYAKVTRRRINNERVSALPVLNSMAII